MTKVVLLLPIIFLLKLHSICDALALPRERIFPYSTTVADDRTGKEHATIHRRQLLNQTSLALVSTLPLTFRPSSARAACVSEKQQKRVLDDIREGLDLAVQASSVQAFGDAADLVNDSLLDESSLRKALDSRCFSNPNKYDPVLMEATIDGIKKFREQLNACKQSQKTEDAVAAMKYGTGARIALNTYLNDF